jgi:hypothetical protein
MGFEEPWGEGIYINEILIVCDPSVFKLNSDIKFINVSIILNSGDIIKICCETFEYEEYRENDGKRTI